MHSSMKTVFLGLGSNIEPREEYLAEAVACLGKVLVDMSPSAIYETEPWGYTDQAAFLNMAVKGLTTLAPKELLQIVKELEVEIGRTPTFRWGPRVIDIDILVYGEDLVLMDDLQIPHARLLERAFVLAPLSDLAPDFTIPGTGMTVKEAAARCPGMDGVHRKDEIPDV